MKNIKEPMSIMLKKDVERLKIKTIYIDKIIDVLTSINEYKSITMFENHILFKIDDNLSIKVNDENKLILKIEIYLANNIIAEYKINLVDLSTEERKVNTGENKDLKSLINSVFNGLNDIDSDDNEYDFDIIVRLPEPATTEETETPTTETPAEETPAEEFEVVSAEVVE